MPDAAHLGAYWGSRAESVDSCASRLAECLRALAGLTPVLSQWKPKGRSLSKALATPVVEVRESRLAELLEHGVNRSEMDGTIISELGYSWAMWNGLSGAAAGVGVLCSATTANIGVPNSFVLELPHPSEEVAAPLYERERMAALLGAVTNAWNPAWAVVTSPGLRGARAWQRAQPQVGWMTYLGADRSVPSGLTGAEVAPMGEGTFIIVAKSSWIRWVNHPLQPDEQHHCRPEP